MAGKQKFNEIRVQYLKEKRVNESSRKYLFNECIDELANELGYDFIDFSSSDLAELIFNRMDATSVSAFESARAAYNNFFNWAFSKRFVYSNPCLREELSLQAFIEHLSYDERLRPYKREYICKEINYNGENISYYNMILLSIYEGIYTSYSELVGLRYTDIDFERGIIHTIKGDREPSDRLLKSFKDIHKEQFFVYTHKKGRLVFIDDRAVPYIMVQKKDVKNIVDDSDAEHRILKSIYKQIQKFNTKNATNFSHQKLWESGIINRFVNELGEKRFVEMMLNPIIGESEHDDLNWILCSIPGWGFKNELAIDKFKSSYRYHALRMKRELGL